MRGQFLLAGMGGQGILFATRVLAYCAVAEGNKVLGSETHGMAQRGGSVVSHLKVGNYESPMVRAGGADFLLSFEPMEAYRYLHMLRIGGTAYVNTKDAGFLDAEVAAALQERDVAIHTVDAFRIARELKAPLSANLVVVGFARASGPPGKGFEMFRETVGRISPPRFAETNLGAFDAGVEAWKSR